MKKEIVQLTPQQRQDLHRLISTGEEQRGLAPHAGIWLKADAGEYGLGSPDEQRSDALSVSPSTIGRVEGRLPNRGCTRLWVAVRSVVPVPAAWMGSRKHTSRKKGAVCSTLFFLMVHAYKPFFDPAPSLFIARKQLIQKHKGA